MAHTQDIVEQLRDRAYSGLPDPLLAEAADEIVRLRAWVNELQLSKVEIDAVQHVVEDGRLVDLADYGRLRSLLIRLRPEWLDDESDRSKPGTADESDRSEPINGPDPDSRVWETPCTPQPHAIPAKGSAQGDGSFRDSRNAKEPVAWAVMYPNGEFGILAFYRREAEDLATASDRVVPLYRSPTLTDAEREAVEFALDRLRGTLRGNRECDHADTLRGLLERLA